MELPEEYDPRSLADVGWGIIVADNTDPAIMDALDPLLQLRQQQAGDRFHKLSLDASFLAGNYTVINFLAQNRVAAGNFIPARIPYYLMIIGGPETISYEFQILLSLEYAVGRIHFETLDQYATYAQDVVASEIARPLSGRLALFDVTHPDDHHTQLASNQFVTPLMQSLKKRYPQWLQQRLVGEHATKASLIELLRANVPPALLLCFCHGVTFPIGDPHQTELQGALLCADWPGPAHWSGTIPSDFYFSVNDLTNEMNLTGMIAVLWCSYGVGTPQSDHYVTRADRKPLQNAERPFLASLPVKMLGQQHGALAVVGLTDRAWGNSFQWVNESSKTAAFESSLGRLLIGTPLGLAFEDFGHAYASLSANIGRQLEDIRFGAIIDTSELISKWTARNDMGNVVIVGDPAVRLSINQLN